MTLDDEQRARRRLEAVMAELVAHPEGRAMLLVSSREQEPIKRAELAEVALAVGGVDVGQQILDELSARCPADPAVYVPASLGLLHVGATAEALRWANAGLARCGGDHPEEYQALIRTRLIARMFLGIPRDEMDHEAERGGEDAPSLLTFSAVLMYWPPIERAAVVARWPQLAEELPSEDHRHVIEAFLRGDAPWVNPVIRTRVTGVFRATREAYEQFAVSERRDPGDPLTVRQFGQRVSTRGTGTPWPPAPADPCWCGSGDTYTRCCGI
ncbi:MAG TPA: SEC-C domain-containing protein [Streptosporangiaceae bacterium]